MSDYERDDNGAIVLDENGEPRLTAAATEARSALQARLDAAAALEADLVAQREQNEQAVAAYRDAILKANPAVPPSMVSGATVAEVQASFTTATETVAAIRAAMEQEAANRRLGFQTPGRNGGADADTSSLSPAEKIRLGLERAAQQQR